MPKATAEKLAASAIAVFDPAGETAAFLTSVGQPFTAVQSLDTLPAGSKVLVVGRDAMAATNSTSKRPAVLASEGHAVIVLDQTHPLKYQAIPAEIELAPQTKKSDFGTGVPVADGHTAFIEDMSHPALRGLKDKDFFTWGPDHLVFRNAYLKPARGGKSLVQCGPRHT